MSEEPRSFIARTRVLLGVGAISKLPETARPFTPARAVLVTSPSVVEAGWIDIVGDLLAMVDIPTVLFDGVVPNPRLDTVRAGLDKVGRQLGDLLVAVGGGSVIDTAKAMSVPVPEVDSLRDCAGFDRLADPTVPLIAIPTVSGSGSEVSVWTVLSDPDSRSRLIIGSPRLAPAWAICDPELTVGVPPEITARTAVDGLTHAIESFTSKRAWAPTRVLALGAIEKFATSLTEAWRDGADLDARGSLMTGSAMAGMALNNSGLGIAHALSNPIGGLCDAPHGSINSVLLPHVMEFNLPACPAEYAQIARALGREVHRLSESEAARAAVEAVRELIAAVGLDKTGLGDLGLAGDDIPAAVEAALKSPNIKSNPRPAESSDLIEICRKAL